jgi:hypothetical protein
MRCIAPSGTERQTLMLRLRWHRSRSCRYPLALAANPPAQRFIDIYGKTFNGIANFDESFFESLDRMVQEEPVRQGDMVMMGMLKSVGIEKGKDFKPDAAMQSILKSAAQESQAYFIDTR